MVSSVPETLPPLLLLLPLDPQAPTPTASAATRQPLTAVLRVNNLSPSSFSACQRRILALTAEGTQSGAGALSSGGGVALAQVAEPGGGSAVGAEARGRHVAGRLHHERADHRDPRAGGERGPSH